MQKTKDSNEILKWYYIYLIHFSNEENDSAFADNEKTSKNSKKNIIIMKEDLNQKSTSFLHSRLSLITKISMKQNIQNRKNVESWDFLDRNSDYLADSDDQNFE